MSRAAFSRLPGRLGAALRGRALRAALVLGAAAPIAACAAPTAEKAAASPLDQKLAANPDDAHVNVDLGDRAAASGDWLRAQQYYERAEALGSPPAALIPRMLRVLVQAHRYDEALARCHRRLSATPTDRATRLVAAAILEALDRPREAERELSLLARTRPDDPNPYLALGKLYRDSLGDAARARAMFERYLALAPHGEESDAIRYQLEETAPPPELPPSAPSPPPGGAPSATPNASAPSTVPSPPLAAPEAHP